MSLLPKADELRPGAAKAAREILGALRLGSVVVVDEDRAVAALAEVIIHATIGSAKITARTITDAIETEAMRPDCPGDRRTMFAMAGVFREAYEVKP